MRINNNLSELHQQQIAQFSRQATGGTAATSAGTSKGGKLEEANESTAAPDTDDSLAQVTQQNRAASLTEPLDAKTAAITASALRRQIAGSPQVAFSAHAQLSASRTQELLA